MKRNSMIVSLTTILLLVAAAVTALALGARPNLGLDLQGGISAAYEPDLESGNVPDDLDAALDTAIELIRQRIDSLGVAEPDIARQGDQILVQLPGIDDPQRANEIIGKTAQLTFHPVVNFLLPGTAEYAETPPCYIPQETGADVIYVANPERPSALEDGVACQPIADPNAPPEPLPTDTPTATDGASVAPTEGTPTEGATTDDAATPTETPSALGLGRVSAAAEGDPTEAPSPTATATEPASPAPTETASPVPTELPTPVDDGLPADAPRPLKYVLGDLPTDDADDPLTGDDISDAFPSIEVSGWVVQLELDGDGAQAFANITSELACERDQGGPGQLAIVLDDFVESAPSMSAGVACGTGIAGGLATITVGGDEADARDLALVLDVGALPITLKEATFTAVSPTLGAASLRNGLLAGLVGLILVGIYLVFFYRALGVIALGALAIFGVLIFGLITLLGELGFALTLAGVAGIIVSIGITADSSILFFERIRDEVGLGKTMRTGVKRGFDAAFRTNLAGNTVTLSAALILYFLAVGPVRGFALTLGLATVLDIFIMWFYTRSVVGLLAAGKRLTRKSVRVAEPVAGGAK